MSLRVWLPLNGDLHNQGLSNVTVSSGTPAYGTGKIDTKGLDLINSTQINLFCDKLADVTTFSICCWIKGSKDTNDSDWVSPIRFGVKKSNTAENYDFRFGKHDNASGTEGYPVGVYHNSNNTISNTNNTFTTAEDWGKWVHICFIYDGTNIKGYKNGIQVFSHTSGQGGYLTGNFRLRVGRCNWLVNDLRIYDHCLSVTEVKEIAQGLILHYKLDGGLFGNPNLLAKYVVPGQAAPTSTANGGRTIWLGDYKITIPATENADTYFRLFMTEQLISGTTYTISCKVSGLLNGSYYRFPLFAQNNTNMGVLNLDHNGLCSLTFTMNWTGTQTATTGANGETVYINFLDDSARSLASGQGAITLYDFKLEKGDTVTPWCPADNEMNIDRTIVEDSSGYNHNGEILNGPLSFTNDTSRYDICTHFSATNQKIKISNFPTSGFGNSYTFAWWAKISSVTPMHWGFGDGIRLNGMYTGRLWNTGDSSNNPLYNPGTTTQVTAPTVNVWHHWVMTGDGTKCRVYQDGELWGEAKTYKAISGTTIYINGWNNATDYSSNNYSISDFRIYCTSLLDIDIKQLYNVGMKVDKNNNMHSFELEEDIGIVPEAKFINNSATSVSYDAATDTYTIVSPANTSSWGYGVRLADTPALQVPYGATYRWTAEVWTPVALSVNTDYNNTAGSSDVNWAGNDNDATSTRLASVISIPANTWTRIYRGASNTNNGNTNHLSIRDYSSLGLVTNGQSNPVTWKVRHLQWYLVDNNFKPQLKRTGIFKSSHFTETEDDLNKPVQLNKKMFSTNATQFIER